jgi:hypothetical protein
MLIMMRSKLDPIKSCSFKLLPIAQMISGSHGRLRNSTPATTSHEETSPSAGKNPIGNGNTYGIGSLRGSGTLRPPDHLIGPEEVVNAPCNCHECWNGRLLVNSSGRYFDTAERSDKRRPSVVEVSNFFEIFF